MRQTLPYKKSYGIITSKNIFSSCTFYSKICVVIFMYDVLNVSRYVINYSNIKKYGVSNLKLQKLLYFIQAYFLIVNKETCFKEDIEAWDFGPVVPAAYHEYRLFGSSNIPSIKSYTVIEKNYNDIFQSKIKKIEFDETCISKNDRKLIEEVVDKFSDYSAADLVRMTHVQTPWMSAHGRGRNAIITIEAIRSYFDA